jgi:Na+-driven multidrug efflux pump
MLIGIRILLLFAVLVCATTFIVYLFTKNIEFYKLTLNILKITGLIVAVIAVVFLAERLLFIA